MERKFNSNASSLSESIGLSDTDANSARIRIILSVLQSGGETSVNVGEIIENLYNLVKKDDDALVMILRYYAQLKGADIVTVLGK